MDDKLIKEIKKTVFRHLDPTKVKAFVFGSRASGKNRKYSDVDLGIMAKTAIPTIVKFDLEEEFENSNLPYRVDVVDFSKVSDNFKKVALNNVVNLN